MNKPLLTSASRAKKALRLAMQTGQTLKKAEQNKSALHEIENLSRQDRNFITPLLPLIYNNIKGTDIWEELSEENKSLVKTVYRQTIAADMQNQQQLQQILEQLDKAKIQVVMLKAAAFSGTIYPQNAPRLGVDLDFLVDKQKLKEASDILAMHSESKVPLKNRRHSYQKSFEQTFFIDRQNSGQIILELHSNFFHDGIFPDPPQSFWKRSHPHPSYPMKNVRILSPEDNLVHLAIHAFGNLSYVHHNLLDAHELLSKYDIDWEALARSAQEMSAQKTLFALLSNTRKIFETTLPENLSDMLRISQRAAATIKHSINLKEWIAPEFQSPAYRLSQLLLWPLLSNNRKRLLYFKLNYLRTRVCDMLSS